MVIEDMIFYILYPHLVYIKNGMSNISYFTHKKLDNCDTFTQDMSKWHRE